MTCHFLAIDEPESPAAAERELQSETRGSETILLVEDEDVVRRLARLALEKQGYTVLEANDGQKALAVAEVHAGPIQLIITDVVMPVMGGRQLVERLLPRFPKLRVLYMSGYTDDAILRHCEPSAFLQKPFSPMELSEKARIALDAVKVVPRK